MKIPQLHQGRHTQEKSTIFKLRRLQLFRELNSHGKCGLIMWIYALESCLVWIGRHSYIHYECGLILNGPIGAVG